MRSPHVLGVAAALALGLPGAYLAVGGGPSGPAPVNDPCATRDWRNPEGLDRVAEQIVLSALDGAACDLRVSREELVLALATDGSRGRFATERGIDRARLEETVRVGLRRSIDDAERGGALRGWQADLARVAAARLPIDDVLDAVAAAG